MPHTGEIVSAAESGNATTTLTFALTGMTTDTNGYPVVVEGGDSVTATVTLADTASSTAQTVTLSWVGSDDTTNLVGPLIAGQDGVNDIVIPANHVGDVDLVLVARDDAHYHPTFVRPLVAYQGTTEIGRQNLVWRDDEDPPTATIAATPSTVTEGGNVTVEVRVSERYSTVAGSSGRVVFVSSIDAETTVIVASFDAGETSKEIDVATSDDSAQSSVRTLVFTITDIPSLYTRAEPKSARVAVLDNDTPPTGPRTLRAHAEIEQVKLTWDDPIDGGGGQPIAKYQYRYVQGSTVQPSETAWVDVPESTKDGDNRNGYTVRNLTGGQLHTFLVRAVNGANLVGPAAGTQATPVAATRPTVTSAAFTSPPADGEYNLGETIEVSVTFDMAVTVTGTPRMRLFPIPYTAVSEHFLEYATGAGSATVLAFRRTVTSALDDALNGTRILANSLHLNGGTIRNQGTTTDADRSHEVVTGGANIRTRWIEDIVLSSEPAVDHPEYDIYGPSDEIEITVKFEDVVHVETAAVAPVLNVLVSDVSVVPFAFRSGSGTRDLVFAWTVPDVVAGDEVPFAVATNRSPTTSGRGLELNGAAIENGDGVAVNIRHRSYEFDGAEIDTRPPVLSSTTLNGEILWLVYERGRSDPESLDLSSEPAPTDFAVSVADTPREVSVVSVQGDTVALTLASPVWHAQSVILSYTPGANPIRDRFGNAAAPLNDQPVQNRTPRPRLSIGDVPVGEDDGSADFKVVLNVRSGETVTVDYTSADGTAVAGVDYTAAAGTLTFDPGDDAKTISVMVADDGVMENRETFTVTLANASNASIVRATATATISDPGGANAPPEFDDGTATSRRLAETVGAATVPTAADIGDAVSATDPDGDDTLTYSLEGTDADRFEIVASTGQIRSRAGERYDYEERRSYSVTVRVSDDAVTVTIAVTIEVDDNTDETPLPPSAPTVMTRTGSATELDIAWHAPGNRGRPDIVGYDLRYGTSTETGWSPRPQIVAATSAVIGGLAADTEYQVQVRATNADGDGDWSASGVGRTGIAAAEPEDSHPVLLFASTVTDTRRQGFVRVFNHAATDAEVVVEAIDDSGFRTGPVTFDLAAGTVGHFNSNDLENGNAEKNLPEGVGSATVGDWRLELSGASDIEVSSYMRTTDGFVTSLHDTVPVEGGVHRVAILNPGSNNDQVSHLRLVNPGPQYANTTISGVDDEGTHSGEVVVEVPPEGALDLTSAELEAGTFGDGALGDGAGKWRLTVTSDADIRVMSLLASPEGHLTNLSTVPTEVSGDTHPVLLFPAASDASRQGFVRIINHGDVAAEVSIAAFDESDAEYAPLTLAVDAGAVAHFNSDDLEQGNADKGLTGSTGAGEGDWRLELTSDADIEVLSYIRTATGFLTSLHDVIPILGDRYRVAIFNPGRNTNQVSWLRLINWGDVDAAVTISGLDDSGGVSRTVTTMVPAHGIRAFSAQELETGTEGLVGMLGSGMGKWQLFVESDARITVMSLLESPQGLMTNLSRVPSGSSEQELP